MIRSRHTAAPLTIHADACTRLASMAAGTTPLTTSLTEAVA